MHGGRGSALFLREDAYIYGRALILPRYPLKHFCNRSMNPRMRSIHPFIRSMYHGIRSILLFNRSMSITAVISIHVRKASRSHIWLSAHSSTLSAQTFSQPLNEPSQPLYQSIYPLYVSPQPLNKPPYPLNPHQSKHPHTTPINLATQTKPNKIKSKKTKQINIRLVMSYL